MSASRQYLTAQTDLASQEASEAYVLSEPSTLHSGSRSQEKKPQSPPLDWLSLLRALPIQENLKETTKALRTSIGNDIQLLRADLQGLSDRVVHVEADHDNLMAAQAA
ncbi:Hypothetical predicted protein, partial [Pelobates cultripes]